MNFISAISYRPSAQCARCGMKAKVRSSRFYESLGIAFYKNNHFWHKFTCIKNDPPHFWTHPNIIDLKLVKK